MSDQVVNDNPSYTHRLYASETASSFPPPNLYGLNTDKLSLFFHKDRTILFVYWVPLFLLFSDSPLTTRRGHLWNCFHPTTYPMQSLRRKSYALTFYDRGSSTKGLRDPVSDVYTRLIYVKWPVQASWLNSDAKPNKGGLWDLYRYPHWYLGPNCTVCMQKF